MATVFKLIVVASSLFVLIFAKQLHFKHGNLAIKDKDPQIFMNLLNTEELHSTNERYARHVVVTESVLDHLLSELKREYRNNKKPNSPVRRLIRNLTEELQKRIDKQKKFRQINKAVKIVKDKQKQKKVMEIMNLKNEKKTTKKALRKLKY